MADTSKQKIRIRMKAFDHRLLDQSAAEIIDTAVRTGSSFALAISELDLDVDAS